MQVGRYTSKLPNEMIMYEYVKRISTNISVLKINKQQDLYLWWAPDPYTQYPGLKK